MASRDVSGQRSEALPDPTAAAPPAHAGEAFAVAAAGVRGLTAARGTLADRDLATAVLGLQAAAGNRAVAAQARLARDVARPAVAGPGRALLARAPGTTAAADVPVTNTAAPAPGAVPGRSKVIAPPDPTRGVQPGDDDGVHPAIDLAADQSTVTLTLVLRNFNLPQSGDASTVDFLHEPNVSIQVTPGNLPQPVVQAAIAAMNVHLRRNGRDIAELSINPQVQRGSDGRPSAGASAQVELHVTTGFSITASTSAAVTPHSDQPNDGSLRVTPPNAPVDLNWTPFSVGVLYHLDANDRPRENGPGLDYDALRSDAAIISWVVNQLDRADFTSRGAGELDVATFVTQLLDVMRGAGGEEAQWAIHLGVLQVPDIPAGLTRGLTRAAQLIAGADPGLANLRRVRVSMFNLPPSGDGAERVVRWALLDLAGRTVTPAP
ncbi:hypothetical protein [Solirubrobacter soli]|uniref:hypothetical protein n=1 Tax=Solirubrobacter soli TaxID=363832 RepID=UPI0004092054|nr:hypothetical protein [Solirubrobacter soli]